MKNRNYLPLKQRTFIVIEFLAVEIKNDRLKTTGHYWYLQKNFYSCGRFSER